MTKRSFDEVSGNGTECKAENGGSSETTRHDPLSSCKQRRTTLENKERAFVAASRRGDRSLPDRMKSARSASKVHKERTGKALRITEDIVMGEEMYEEEDDFIPRSVMLLHLRNTPQSIEYEERMREILNPKRSPDAAAGQIINNDSTQQNVETQFSTFFPSVPQQAEQVRQLLAVKLPTQPVYQENPQASSNGGHVPHLAANPTLGQSMQTFPVSGDLTLPTSLICPPVNQDGIYSAQGLATPSQVQPDDANGLVQAHWQMPPQAPTLSFQQNGMNTHMVMNAFTGNADLGMNAFKGNGNLGMNINMNQSALCQPILPQQSAQPVAPGFSSSQSTPLPAAEYINPSAPMAPIGSPSSNGSDGTLNSANLDHSPVVDMQTTWEFSEADFAKHVAYFNSLLDAGRLSGSDSMSEATNDTPPPFDPLPFADFNWSDWMMDEFLNYDGSALANIVEVGHAKEEPRAQNA